MLEITIRRGVSEYEMDTLMGKLGAHRLSSAMSYLYIIKGGSRKKVGSMDRVDLAKLRDMVIDCLAKYSTAGLLVIDTVSRGALHKAHSHGMVFKEQLRQFDFGAR